VEDGAEVRGAGGALPRPRAATSGSSPRQQGVDRDRTPITPVERISNLLLGFTLSLAATCRRRAAQASITCLDVAGAGIGPEPGVGGAQARACSRRLQPGARAQKGRRKVTARTRLGGGSCRRQTAPLWPPAAGRDRLCRRPSSPAVIPARPQTPLRGDPTEELCDARGWALASADGPELAVVGGRSRWPAELGPRHNLAPRGRERPPSEDPLIICPIPRHRPAADRPISVPSRCQTLLICSIARRRPGLVSRVLTSGLRWFWRSP